MTSPIQVAILGATGSIGTQTLDVIARYPERFRAAVLTAHSRCDELIRLALIHRPDLVVIADDTQYAKVCEGLAGTGIEVAAGEEALCAAMESPGLEVVVSALVGFAGLKPTIRAIKRGLKVALANKETLVVAGEIMMALAKKHGMALAPVDSEHSAIFQCLAGETENKIEKIILTASGGPFRGYSFEQLSKVTPAQALKHPNWEMGAKITIDSASMMNKGLEVIEARWLFDVSLEQIEVVVHPQSIIHSLVQFEDGSIKAQLGLPDMRLPIQYALTYPERWPNDFPRFSFAQYPNLTFEQVDTTVFRNLGLAFEALRLGGNAACVLNAANEETNRFFREGKISFTQMAELNEATLNATPFVAHPDLESLYASDLEARARVHELLKANQG